MAVDSWLTPKAKLTPDAPGEGRVTAHEQIRAGEVIAVRAGAVLSREALATVAAERAACSMQIGPDQYLVPGEVREADRINHSCSPNAGMRGDRTLIALREILPGEEICYDYAMTDDSDYRQFPCLCGVSECRGQVQGGEWKRPDLQERYVGYFSIFVEDLIARQNRKPGDVLWADEV